MAKFVKNYSNFVPRIHIWKASKEQFVYENVRFLIIFENRKKIIIKPKNIDLETILAPLGRPLEAMLGVLEPT